VAAKRLSADVINFSAKGSSVSKGESLKDTALTLEAMGADAVVVRHQASGAPHRLAHWIRGSVVNAGDGTHEHPTQALLDAFTMRQRLGRVEGLRVAVVGDVLHSRVARSNVLLLHTLGAEVTLVAPPTLLPVGVEAWPSAVSFDSTESSEERRRDDAAGPAGADARRFLPDHARILPPLRTGRRRMRRCRTTRSSMHPGPMNRGVEIAAEGRTACGHRSSSRSPTAFGPDGGALLLLGASSPSHRRWRLSAWVLRGVPATCDKPTNL